MSDVDRTADALADLLGVDPEDILTEPRQGRVSLTVSQANRLIDLARRGTATLVPDE